METYCLERNIPFSTYGSWTLKARDRSRGAEPDECWVFGEAPAERPHLAVEVVWTSGRIDKLDIYRKLGVAEVWYWRQGRIQPYGLRGERYVPVPTHHLRGDPRLSAGAGRMPPRRRLDRSGSPAC